MKMVTLAITYKFNIGVTKEAVRNAFDNARLTFALREATKKSLSNPSSTAKLTTGQAAKIPILRALSNSGLPG